MKNNTFYITSPIFYPNAKPHMGHAYTTLVCDVLARYHRLVGDETHFLTGTDENTEKVIQAAEKLEKEPRAYLDYVVEQFKDLYSQLGISYDQFIRTTDQEIHWPGATEMWKRLEASGDIYKSKYEGLYCVGCESFLLEKDLVDGKCPDHDTKPERLSEENYFFKLSKYTDEIRKIIEDDVIQILSPSRKNEVLSFLDSGLEDVSFSRPREKVSWGVPVPGDESQVMYIWVDALTNYVTALGFGRGEEDMRFWPGMHVIGKDILRFHAIIWPAMLLSANLPLPKTILVHGMITSGGKKMSKSLGNVIDPFELIEKYGSDAVRYYLARHISPFDDGDLTLESFHEAYTANLVNGLGNLVSRIMKMAETHLDGPVDRPEAVGFDQAYIDALEAFNLQSVCDIVWKKIGDLDERIAEEQPFKVIKEDLEKGKEMIKTLVLDLYIIGRMLYPILPEANVTIKEAVLTNTKPENLFERLDD